MIVLFASSCVPARDNFKKVPLSDKITLLVWANAGSSFMAFAKEGFMILLLCVSFSLNYLLLYQKKKKKTTKNRTDSNGSTYRLLKFRVLAYIALLFAG